MNDGPRLLVSFFAVIGLAMLSAATCGAPHPGPPPRPPAGTSVYNSAWDSIAVSVNGYPVRLGPFEGVFWVSPDSAYKFGWQEGVTWRFDYDQADSSLVTIRWEWYPPPMPGWGEEWVPGNGRTTVGGGDYGGRRLERP